MQIQLSEYDFQKRQGIKNVFSNYCAAQFANSIMDLRIAEYDFYESGDLVFSSASVSRIKNVLHNVKDKIFYILKIMDEDYILLDWLFALLEEGESGNASEFFTDYFVFCAFLEHWCREINNEKSIKRQVLNDCLDKKWDFVGKYVTDISQWFLNQSYIES